MPAIIHSFPTRFKQAGRKMDNMAISNIKIPDFQHFLPAAFTATAAAVELHLLQPVIRMKLKGFHEGI